MSWPTTPVPAQSRRRSTPWACAPGTRWSARARPTGRRAGPALSLGATVRFADIDPDTLCVDPEDLERRLTPRTKVVVVVHYCGHPADMDAVLAITEPRGIAVMEDVSHAHGALYRGRKVGTFGAVAAMSVMSGKALPAGEGGIMVTSDRGMYERALAWGHYSRGQRELTDPELVRSSGIALGRLQVPDAAAQRRDRARAAPPLRRSRARDQVGHEPVLGPARRLSGYPRPPGRRGDRQHHGRLVQPARACTRPRSWADSP